MTDVVKVWDDGPVRIVQINRPEKGNAISAEVAVGIQDAMVAFDQDDALRCAVITGAGPKAFSVGADVTRLPELWRCIPTVGYRPTKPVIAAVEGWCTGGALVVAMMADLCVTGRSGKFYYPEAKIGLTGGMIAALPGRIPHKIAMELILLCRVVGAERAAQVGLVNEVVDDGKALETAIAWGKEMAGFAPMVMGTLKQVITEEILPRGPSEIWALHGQRLDAIRYGEDAREGAAAFREKRPPVFRNR
jgi:enoyl-CoA hydratase/carnithine racemase